MDKDKIYITHILEAVSFIEESLKTKNADNLKTDKMLRDSIIRNLEIIGEASKNLSEKFRSGTIEINWPEMISMRNRLIHEYFGVDLEVVWQTIQNDLPLLKKVLSGKK